MEHALHAFAEEHPRYLTTAAIDELREREFSRLDRAGHVYLDYTGSGLYADSQVQEHLELLRNRVFGNPHSINPTSRSSTEGVERCRSRVLDYFGASPREYTVAFTANASQALKLVGEAYPFEPDGEFLLTFDNHNSVNGIREFARARGARVQYIPMVPPELRVDERAVDAALARGAGASAPRLFAFPAQSNFSGVQHPLGWIDRAHQAGADVLLDAAAFAPTNRLDLSRLQPEFVTLSFYKMFGYPTGVGALIARHTALDRLRRPWFAGGTIDVVSVQADRFQPARGAARFEDGTPDFLAIPAVCLGLDLLETVGIDMVHERVRALTDWLLGQFRALVHRNGQRLVQLYGPASTDARGGSLAFNLLADDASVIDHALVDERAAAEGISLRTGCFCNPGAGELAFGLTRDDIVVCLDGSAHPTYHEFRRCVDPRASGAIRASVGLVSNFRDVWRLINFLRTFLQ